MIYIYIFNNTQKYSLPTLCFQTIYMMDGSWTLDSFFFVWLWLDLEKNIGYDSTYGHKISEKDSILIISLKLIPRISQWTMKNMFEYSTFQRFETYSKNLILMIADSRAWPSFFSRVERVTCSKRRFQDFIIIYHPQSENNSANSLAEMKKYFIEIVFR